MIPMLAEVNCSSAPERPTLLPDCRAGWSAFRAERSFTTRLPHRSHARTRIRSDEPKPRGELNLPCWLVAGKEGPEDNYADRRPQAAEAESEPRSALSTEPKPNGLLRRRSIAPIRAIGRPPIHRPPIRLPIGHHSLETSGDVPP
jgi:hypothetical protein